MSNRISLFRRRSDLSEAAFSHHWRVIHAPVALSLPALEQYEQNTVQDRTVFGATALSERIIDGICKLRFADAAGLQGVLDPDIVKVLREDEAQFLEDLCTLSLDSTTLAPAPTLTGVAYKAFLLLDLNAATTSGPLPDAIVAAARAAQVGHVRHRVTGRTMARVPVGRDELPIDLIEEFQLDDAVLPPAFIAALRQQIAAAGGAGILLVARSHSPSAEGSCT